MMKRTRINSVQSTLLGISPDSVRFNERYMKSKRKYSLDLDCVETRRYLENVHMYNENSTKYYGVNIIRWGSMFVDFVGYTYMLSTIYVSLNVYQSNATVTHELTSEQTSEIFPMLEHWPSR